MYVIYQSYWSGNKKIPRGLQMITDQSLSHTIYNIRTSFEGTIKRRSRGMSYYIAELHTMYADVKLSIKLTLTKLPLLPEPCSVYDYITLITISIDIAVLLFS